MVNDESLAERVGVIHAQRMVQQTTGGGRRARGTINRNIPIVRTPTLTQGPLISSSSPIDNGKYETTTPRVVKIKDTDDAFVLDTANKEHASVIAENDGVSLLDDVNTFMHTLKLETNGRGGLCDSHALRELRYRMVPEQSPVTSMIVYRPRLSIFLSLIVGFVVGMWTSTAIPAATSVKEYRRSDDTASSITSFLDSLFSVRSIPKTINSGHGV